MGLCVFIYCIGLFFHFASDMQKTLHLELAPGTLIQTRLWARLRNPNYFGELLIYLSFALLAAHPLSFIIFAGIIVGVWLPGMWAKDQSLKRYKGWDQYERRSYFWIPFIW